MKLACPADFGPVIDVFDFLQTVASQLEWVPNDSIQ